MDDYFMGHDLDAHADGEDERRDARGQEHFQGRCDAGARRAPYAGAAGGHYLAWLSAADLPRRHIHEVGVEPAVSTGFGRYIPHTVAGAVRSRQWQFVPVFGGLRVALPTRAMNALAAEGGAPAASAAAIAGSPAVYGYVLHNDTFVPATLTPSDRHLLARAPY